LTDFSFDPTVPGVSTLATGPSVGTSPAGISPGAAGAFGDQTGSILGLPNAGGNELQLALAALPSSVMIPVAIGGVALLILLLTPSSSGSRRR
jgi:hypothetical protein